MCLPCSGSDKRTHPAVERAIALDEDSNKLWVMLASTEANSVEYRNLLDKDKTLFNQSRNKELRGLFDFQAYRILSVAESEKFRRLYPDCVLPSRWVDRWKAQDAGGPAAKSRLHGYPRF